MTLTDDHLRFMRMLAPSGRIPVPRSRLAVVADRAQDKVRQQCKRLGYVEFVGGIIEGKYRPMGWRLTDEGRAALNKAAYPLPVGCIGE